MESYQRKMTFFIGPRAFEKPTKWCKLISLANAKAYYHYVVYRKKEETDSRPSKNSELSWSPWKQFSHCGEGSRRNLSYPLRCILDIDFLVYLSFCIFLFLFFFVSFLEFFFLLLLRNRNGGRFGKLEPKTKRVRDITDTAFRNDVRVSSI